MAKNVKKTSKPKKTTQKKTTPRAVTTPTSLQMNKAFINPPKKKSTVAKPGKYSQGNTLKKNAAGKTPQKYTPTQATYTPATYNAVPDAQTVTYNPVQWTPSQLQGVDEAGIRSAYQKTADEANAAYKTAYETKVKGLQETANANRETANRTYDTGARNAYGNYLEAQKNARDTAANSGMTGGVVERMAVNSANNYQKSYSANEAGRQKSLANIQADYNEKASGAQVDYQNTVAANNLAAQTQAQQAIDTANNEYQNRVLEQERMRQNVDLQNAQGQQNVDLQNAQMKQNVAIANAQGQQAVNIANAQGKQAVDTANKQMEQDAYLDYLNRKQTAEQNKANRDIENKKIKIDEKQYKQNREFQKEEQFYNRLKDSYGGVISKKVLKKEANRYDKLIQKEKKKKNPDKKKIQQYTQYKNYLKSVKGQLKLNK